jgi:rhamnogalacturonyl hydrolase YesR
MKCRHVRVFLVAIVVAGLAGAAGCGDTSSTPAVDIPATDVPGDLLGDLDVPGDPADPGTPDVEDVPSVDVPDVPPADTLGGDPGPLPGWTEHPTLVTRPDRKAAILARIDREPWAGILGSIRATAAGECIDDTGDEWDSGTFGNDGRIAQANAVLAWLLDDSAAAEKARGCFGRIRTDWETNTVWDINIRMADGSISFAVAWDLLAGTTMFPAAEAAEARRRLVTINEKFYERYVLDDYSRWTALTVSQNNHPIRTTSAMGFVALAFPDEPRSREILDFAAGELDYLWGPTGRYIQDDGVVSEEPFYFGFGFPPAIAFFLAMRNAWPADGLLYRNCINRNDVDPWAPIDCTDGMPYQWEDPLALPFAANSHSQRLWSAFQWSLDHRMPNGLRSTTGDGSMRVQNAGLLLSGISGYGWFAWDARHNINNDMSMTRGMDLMPQHLFDITTAPVDNEPSWKSSGHLVSGHATLRTGWGTDDLWVLLLGESGAARKTLHDHADGTSFALAAFGEYLLLDSGYYKPNNLDNAVTADAPSHNVILIDGQGAPTRGLLNDWGDADATMTTFHDGDNIDVAQVRQTYQQATITRTLLMVRDRYTVVADQVQSDVGTARDFTWRVNGYAGYDAGGTYAIDATGATFRRDKAAIRVAIASTAGEPVVAEPPFVAGQAPHAHSIDSGYGNHAVADATINAVAPGFLAVLAPWKTGIAAGMPDGQLTVTRVASGEGSAAWTITGTYGPAGDAHIDLVWLREAGAPETLDVDGVIVTSNARITVLALNGGLAYADGGNTLELYGTAVPLPDAVSGTARVLDPPFDACAPGVPISNACFAQKRAPESDNVALATAIAHRQMTRVAADKLSWDWVPSVMMSSFCELHRVTGDPELLAYVKAWIDHHVAAGYTMMSSDTASPVTAAFYVWQATGDAKYRAVVDDFLEYAEHEALRTPEGGINHLGTLEIMGITLWVDSLWMVGVPLARIGALDGPTSTPWLDAETQFRVFQELLQEPAGFLHHAVNWALPQDEGIYWGRGNGWVLASVAEYLRLAGTPGGARQPFALSLLRRLTNAARAAQDPATGLWWTVLNRPGETYLETSVGGLFAFGMARAWRYGLLGDEVLPSIALALQGIRSRVVEGTDGPVITGTSGPTTAGTFAEYAKVKVEDDIPYGIGAVILALLETSGMPLPTP